jgi:hypothetical protein
MQTRIQRDFIVKKKKKQGYVPKLMLNKLKVINNFTSIYTYWAPNSKKFIKKFIIYMWPMCTHM